MTTHLDRYLVTPSRDWPAAVNSDACCYRLLYGTRTMTRLDERWRLEELVRAQRLACDGLTLEEIASALGRSREDVRCRLEPEPAPARQATANVGFAHMKMRPREPREER
jgi:hypothetical protein